MSTTCHKVLTPTGIARVIERGIRATFAPENQNAELSRLAELLGELAMSRGADAEFAERDVECRRAESDADWLDAIADSLQDCASLQSK